MKKRKKKATKEQLPKRVGKINGKNLVLFSNWSYFGLRKNHWKCMNSPTKIYYNFFECFKNRISLKVSNFEKRILIITHKEEGLKRNWDERIRKIVYFSTCTESESIKWSVFFSVVMCGLCEYFSERLHWIDCPTWFMFLFCLKVRICRRCLTFMARIAFQELKWLQKKRIYFRSFAIYKSVIT